MKIVETTPDHLVIEDRPRFLAGLVWFMGGISVWAALAGETDGLIETALVALLGVGALWIAHHFFPFQRLIFDKGSDQFTRVVARINGRILSTHALSDIERAAIEAQWSEGSRMERLTLIINGEKLPLEFGFHNTSRKALEREINSWLSSLGHKKPG